MTTDAQPGGLATALARLQAKLPSIKKSETAKVQTDKASYSYTYANLADISAKVMPLLGECGLSFIARPTLSGDRFVLAYSLLHTSGEREDGEYPLPSGGSPQAVGSAITYGRRYCLCAVTGVAPDDDDDDAQAATYHATISRSWIDRADRAQTVDEARQLWRQAKHSGAGESVLDHIANRAAELAPDPAMTGGADESSTTNSGGGEPPANGQDKSAPPPAQSPDDVVTKKQVQAIATLMSKRGLTDRTEALEYVRRVIGRDVDTRNDLTKGEASDVIEALKADTVQEAEPHADEATVDEPKGDDHA